jgi:osmotically inducible lipoprotein OsmB
VAVREVTLSTLGDAVCSRGEKLALRRRLTRSDSMRSTIAVLGVTAAVALAGCSNMTTTQQRTLSGGAMGAAGGAVIGAIAGNAGLGAAAGAGAGLLGGYVYDSYEKSKESSYQKGYQAGASSQKKSSSGQ